MKEPESCSEKNKSMKFRPRATRVDFGEDVLILSLDDGRTLSFPLEWFPRLREASDEDRRKWRFIGRGYGIHWPTLDEDVSVPGLP